jgi:hypothetical protein
MADRNEVEHIIEQVVTQVLQGHLAHLREELVRRVLDELPSELGASSAPEAGADPVDLLRAVSTIHAGTTQKEILRALLDGVSHYCGRTALFVIKGGAASGWQGRGFEDNDAVKDFVLDTARGLPHRVLQERAAFSGQIIDMDPRFVDHFGGPADEQILMLPLALKDKVAALLYADCGLDAGRLDSAALELLVISTSAWLELTSTRKQAPREGVGFADTVAPVASTQTVSSFSDPFAGHSPRHAAAAAAAPAYEPAEVVAEPPVVAARAAGAAAGGGAAALSPEDADTHRKAQRFARLLVDEIKLYNQAKVAEGRRNKDLYDRLKEDIEKSRSTYKKRYGNTVAATTDYFQAELVRSLAEDDVSIMGANFRR